MILFIQAELVNIQRDIHLLPADNSAISHKVCATIGVQYSEICQSPLPISGISSWSPPRPFNTAPGITGTFGINDEPAKCIG